MKQAIGVSRACALLPGEPLQTRWSARTRSSSSPHNRAVVRCSGSLIREVQAQILGKERSAVEVAQEYLSRVEKYNDQVNSYIHVATEQALEQARQVDQVQA